MPHCLRAPARELARRLAACLHATAWQLLPVTYKDRSLHLTARQRRLCDKQGGLSILQPAWSISDFVSMAGRSPRRRT